MSGILSVDTPSLYGAVLLDGTVSPNQDSTGPSVRLIAAPPSLFEQVARRMGAWDVTSSWFRYGALGDGRAYLHWDRLCDFLVSPDGRVIEYNLMRRDAQESFENYLFTHAMSFALLKQGVESLHATTIFVDGHGIAFLGDSGVGKSTLAAGFLQAGARLVTDDLLVFFTPDGVPSPRSSFYACPGPARVKLFPHTAQALLGLPPAAPPMHPDTSKIVLRLTSEQHCIDPVPVSVLYVIEPPLSLGGEDVTIEPLGRADAFLAVLRNTFNAMVTDTVRLTGQFRFASSLARSLPVRRLRYPRTLSRLPSVVSAVRTNLRC